MSGSIPQNILDDILDKVDIVELISAYLPLQRAGRNFKALCPFHHEKTPSFMVNPQRQIFHCFGCGKGGNAFIFLMEYERMDFIETVKTLARKTGVILPQQNTSGKTDGLISGLYKITETARSFYQNTLKSTNGISARDYLNKRDINDETLNFFCLGLSLNNWDGLLNFLRRDNLSLAMIEKSGLVSARSQGGYYDRFRNRLIFPIFDIKSRVVAFGARVLTNDAAGAKYINSPESLIYTKGRHLYGLNFTREAIRQNDCAIVVEGYFDCITVYQAEVKNVVACLGTSLTSEQVKLLKRYTDNVVMIYDSDQAGQDATLRSLDIFIREAMNVKVALLSPGFDPDSFIRKFGVEAFKERVGNAKGLFDYKLDLLSLRYDSTKPEGKARVAREILISLNNLKDTILQSEYIRRLAQALEIKEELLINELRKIKDKKVYRLSELIKESPLKINPTEKLLLNLILRETELVNQLKPLLGPEDFQDSRVARVFSLICDLISRGETVHPSRLIGYLNDRESASFISEILTVDESSGEDTEAVLNDCVNRIKKQRLNSRCQSLQKEITTAQQQGNYEQLNQLITEFRDMQRLRT